MEIDYINGVRTNKIFGMSKYQMEIVKRIDVNLNVIEYDSLMHFFEKKFSTSRSTTNTLNPSAKANRSMDSVINIGKKTLATVDKYRYIREVKNNIKKDNIKHITSQELAYLINSVELENNVVTCYDLIPWVYDNERSSIWKENMNGLKQADCIITISNFSKDEIVKYLQYPEDQIRIVYPGVDHSIYSENRDKNILNNYGVSNEDKIVLYVGSETPRMNVPVLLKAFSRLKKMIPDVKLIKIGESQSYGARENILKVINGLNLQDDVIFAGYVEEEEMPRWYNAADVLVYPCDYAGFGLPPLEAMSCGTPVITSNTSSLPEVVGDAGMMVDPKDPDVMSDRMLDLLTDDLLRNKMITKGMKRAEMFSWDESAKKTSDTYKMMI